MVGILVAIAMSVATTMACVEKPADAPYATVVFYAPAGQTEAVDRMANRYAIDHSFAYGAVRLGARTPQELVIHLVRPDAQIIGRDPFTPGRFQFFFYKSRGVGAASDEEMAKLVSDFTKEVNQFDQFKLE